MLVVSVNPWLTGAFDQTVTRLRASTSTDAYGNTVLDWSNPDSLDMPARLSPPILKVRLGSHAADEDMSGRDAIRHDFEAWVANDDWTALDRAAYNGLTYEVMGNPGRRTDMDGNYLYTKILLREVSG
jgi:hypothetical protein